MSGRLLIALACFASLTAACAVVELDENPLTGSATGDRIDSRGSGSIGDDESATLDLGPDEVVQAALRDVEAFWAREFEALYNEPYVEIRGGFHPYGPESEPVPCGPGLTYDLIAENAFYCPSEDLIAWDEVGLIPPLYDDFGGFTIGIVFAHEFGHAIQGRAVSPDLPTIVLELQADCFAGAWTADVAAGNSNSFAVSGDDLDASVAGFLTLRDQVGTEASNIDAHGSGFDRIGAFQDGLENGLRSCAEYEVTFPDVFQFGFLDFEDEASGGNLPFDEVVPFTVDDLEGYWTFVFERQLGQNWRPVRTVAGFDPARDVVGCGDDVFSEAQLRYASFYCITDDAILFDAANLMPELYELGDFAMGFELARQYAFAAQVRLGDTDNSVESELQADCLAGAYVASTLPGVELDREQFLVSSPGDLDEAIISFLAGADENESSPFERVAAFRTGVSGLGEVAVCGV